MPIDLLGQSNGQTGQKKILPKIPMHIPTKEEKQKFAEAQAKKVVPVREIVKPVAKGPEANLVKGFGRRLLAKRLTWGLILVILLLAISGTSCYFIFFYQPPAPVKNLNTNANTALPVCGNGIIENGEQCEAGIFPGNCQTDQDCLDCQCATKPIVKKPVIPIVLPDTELAPLRGALVRFADNPLIYLIERNGELRVVKEGAVFKNGQSISKISPALIYSISSHFSDIRKGKDVYGRIDWDPRVLLLQELKNYQ